MGALAHPLPYINATHLDLLVSSATDSPQLDRPNDAMDPPGQSPIERLPNELITEIGRHLSTISRKYIFQLALTSKTLLGPVRSALYEWVDLKDHAYYRSWEQPCRAQMNLAFLQTLHSRPSPGKLVLHFSITL